MKAWIRHLQINLTSSTLKKTMEFGINYLSDKDDLSIDVQMYKYLSTLKDTATIQITNLTLAEVIQIIDGKYYDVEIKCGYKSGNITTVYSGSVLYISNETNNRNSNTIIILCASKLVAKYGQTRLNLNLNSSTNIFAAINYVCRRAGIQNTNVSTQFKKQFLNSVGVENTNVATWLDNMCSNNSSFIVNSDASNTSILSIFDAAKSNNRVIILRDDNIILQNYPRLTTEGVTIDVMPTFNFMPGDVIKIDNSIIQIPVRNKSEISKNYGYFLDKDGYYMVFEVRGNFQNRGSNFNLQLLCKSRSLLSSYLVKGAK